MKTSSLQSFLEDLHQRFRGLGDGAVADYIPELTKADPEWFGIAIVTSDGHVYQVGDTRQPFTIQSISKAFTYGIALEDNGVEGVRVKIDVEPSGEAFNSISLEPETGRPRNPMINAGAIVATGLVSDASAEGRLGRIMEVFGRYAGHGLGIDEEVYASEQSTGHRNRAISHMLRNYEILNEDPAAILDAYFHQCSILVNCRDLALMGATLANNGVNPITGVRALSADKVPMVLSVMATCGMYDYSGNWIYSVGMPAKSGVGGGVVAVLPGQLGLAVFSPRLDAKGNSVRGIAVCEAISEHFGLHMLRSSRMTSATVIRNRYDLSTIRSKLNRPPEQSALLDELGKRVEVLELSGELVFVSVEIVVAELSGTLADRSHVIIDLRRVNSIDQPAMQLLVELAESLEGQGKCLVLTGFDQLHGVIRNLKRRLGQPCTFVVLDQPSLDQALEWCEGELLAGAGQESTVLEATPLGGQILCQGLDLEELELLEGLLTRERHTAGSVICAEGCSAEHLYFLESGQVSTWIALDGQHRYRLFGSSAGWTFGESALFGGHKRTADVVADTDVILLCLQPKRLEQSDHPLAVQLRMKLFRNLAELNQNRLKQANAEIRILNH